MIYHSDMTRSSPQQAESLSSELQDDMQTKTNFFHHSRVLFYVHDPSTLDFLCVAKLLSQLSLWGTAVVPDLAESSVYDNGPLIHI